MHNDQQEGLSHDRDKQMNRFDQFIDILLAKYMNYTGFPNS